jgi:NADPH:quinone reductase-like Zn-dependent oxidoreductase
MKAIALPTAFVSEISHLTVHNIPAPVPKSDKNEILVNISHAAVQHVDLLYARGLHQNNHRGLVAPPFVLGLEFAGIVQSAPAKSGFTKGERVFGSGVGAFAEQIAVPEAALSRVPHEWSLRDAAAVGSAAQVSYGAVVRCGGLQRGETVLVHAAAGGLGIMACQIVLAHGGRVIATVGSEEKAEVVRGLGVGEVVRYDRAGWEKEVMRTTGGTGVDLVYDTVGLVKESITCARFRGRVVIAGFAGRGGEMEKLAMNRVLLKNVQLLGYRYGETGRRDPGENKLIAEEVRGMIARGEIRPVVYGDRYAGLEDVPRALADSAARRIWGKAVIDIRPELELNQERPRL